MENVGYLSAMLVTGAMNTLTKKYQMGLCSPSLDGSTSPECAKSGHEGEKFNKPWFQNLMMFCGELSCFIIYRSMKRRERTQRMLQGIYLILLTLAASKNKIEQENYYAEEKKNKGHPL